MIEPHSSPIAIPPNLTQHDEIDLRELLRALWGGKITIVLSTFICAIAAIGYAMTAQEWWTSTAKVTAPQPQDLAAYQQQVQQFQPIFDLYQDDGSVQANKELDALVAPNMLFHQFVDEFNSTDNKRDFLQSAPEFQKIFQATQEDATSEGVDDETERRAYAQWFDKIDAQLAEKNQAPYILSFQAMSPDSSTELLTGYIHFVSQNVRQDALNNLSTMVENKRHELMQRKRILEAQATQRLKVEAERTEYALDIAQAARIDKPIESYNDDELFAINTGSKALAAKRDALKSIDNLSLIEPRLQQLDSKLEMLNHLKVDKKAQFQTFSYLEHAESPISRDKPKKALIAVLGVLLGGMIGVAIVLGRFAWLREEKSA